MNRKVLVVKLYQRVDAFHIDHPEESRNPRDWIVVATEEPQSCYRTRGMMLDEDDVYWYYDWWEGKYAVDVERMIRPCIREVK